MSVKSMLVNQLAKLYQKGKEAPKPCACMGGHTCSDFGCPVVWVWLLEDTKRLEHIIRIGRAAVEEDSRFIKDHKDGPQSF